MPAEYLPRPPLDLRKLDEIHQLVLRAAAKSGNPVIAELADELRSGRMTAVEAARSTAYSEALADGAGRLRESAQHLRPVDIRTDIDDSVLRRTVSEMAIWVEQFEADTTPPPEKPQQDKETDDEYFTDRPIMTGPATERPAETVTAPRRARWTRHRR
jgi:hypothetical protein